MATMRMTAVLGVVASAALVLSLAPAQAAPSGSGTDNAADGSAAATAAFWTPERRAAAIPRDLVIDATGQSYLRGPQGFAPYGRPLTMPSPSVSEVSASAVRPEPQGKPSGGGGSDVTPPTFGTMDPDAKTVTSPYPFRAAVSDTGGVRSVAFYVTPPGGAATKFTANQVTTGVWGVTLNVVGDGAWSWYATAKDKAGNAATSATKSFTVGSGGGGGGGAVADATNSLWPGAGTVQKTAGRIYFYMPADVTQSTWVGYVCSGTAVKDPSGVNRSIILTAAHCVYDDANKAFARNVMFIPDQDHSTAKTDRNCANDPMGCWVPSFGVVDNDWASRSWPNNISWDYAYYVVPTTGAYVPGITTVSASLETAVGGGQVVSFASPVTGTTAAALGYSYSDDPNFMYCQQSLAATGSSNWWLSACRLSGGASGGPWLQPVDSGNGPVFSVNSWGYQGQPGMAGPKLVGTSASCMFDEAQIVADPGTTIRGVLSNCAP